MQTRGAAKVLVVDDAAFMRVVLKDILIQNGLASQIFEAGDGLLAIEEYKKNRPDLVTMDVNMPRADGLQALKSILQLDPKAKVIMVTSVEQKHIVQEAMKSGAKDYVVKPFERSKVGITVNKVLRSA